MATCDFAEDLCRPATLVSMNGRDLLCFWCKPGLCPRSEGLLMFEHLVGSTIAWYHAHSCHKEICLENRTKACNVHGPHFCCFVMINLQVGHPLQVHLFTSFRFLSASSCGSSSSRANLKLVSRDTARRSRRKSSEIGSSYQ